jgi:hypothetical protein
MKTHNAAFGRSQAFSRQPSTLMFTSCRCLRTGTFVLQIGYEGLHRTKSGQD